ncbi:MAG: hypothetical protein AB7N76_02520 [Planctomycetota bacterium]
MTHIVGSDPLPGPETTDDVWESTGPGQRVVWIGSNQTLFWTPATGAYQVWEYRWTGVPVKSDPYLETPTSQGSWNDAQRKASQQDRNVVQGELLYLGNHQLLHWVPDPGGGSRYRLWRLDPKSRTDPITQLLAEGRFQKLGSPGQRLLYIGGDRVLGWIPKGSGDFAQTHSFYELFKLNRAARGAADPLAFLANGDFGSIGAAHDLIYLGKDRMLVWERARKVHPEEPNKKATSRYRAFRVDRKVTGFSAEGALLPNPVLAEGLWYSIFETPEEPHRLIPIGDGDKLRMIDLVGAAAAAKRRVRIWPINNDIPEITGVPGVTLVRRGNGLRVSVLPRKLMAARNNGVENATAGPTVEQLADELRLSPEQTFRELLGFPENVKTVLRLYADQFPEAAKPNHGQASRQLARKGRGAVANSRYGYISENQFRAWPIDPNLTIELSLSKAFQTEVLTAGAKKQQVELRLKMAQPHFDALKQKVEALERALVPLNLAADGLAIALERSYKDLGLLNALDALLGFMADRPKAGASFDKGKVEGLKGLVKELISQHQQHTIVDPKHLQDRKQARDQAATKVLGLLEDADFLTDLTVFAENVDLTKTSLERLVLDTIRNTYQLLLVSNHSDHVLADHVMPAIQAAAAKVKLKDLPSSGNPKFDEVLGEDLPVPAKVSALSILASRTAPAGTAVGNLPGPPTMAVVIFHMAAPALARTIATVPGLNRFGGISLRALCWCGNFEKLQRLDAMNVVAKRDLALTRKLDWSGKFTAGPAATAALGLLNLVAVLAILDSDEGLTKKNVVALISSGGNVGAASVQFAQAFIRALNVGRLGTAANFAGKTLGVVAGFAAAGLGAVQAMEERQSGDDLGFWLAAAGASGAYVTASAFLVAGSLSSATPAGVVLITIGLVIGLGAGILQVWRDIFTNATHTVVEAMVSQYERNDGSYSFASDKPGAGPLKAAFEAVKKAHHPGLTGFMPVVDPDPRPDDPKTNLKKPTLQDGGIELLYDAGFEREAIQLIVDDTKTTNVLKRLLDRRDYPLRRNKQGG